MRRPEPTISHAMITIRFHTPSDTISTETCSPPLDLVSASASECGGGPGESNPVIPIRRAAGRTHLLPLPPPDPVSRTMGWSGSCECPRPTSRASTIGGCAGRAAAVGTKPEPGSHSVRWAAGRLRTSVTGVRPSSRAVPLAMGGTRSGGGHREW